MKSWSGLQHHFKELQLREPQAMLLARTLEFLLQAAKLWPTAISQTLQTIKA